ncbi:MAG: elongation factor G [Oscillospiraceae bacterium]|nr:elongation factor G [Oscillospiraceae bacterium]
MKQYSADKIKNFVIMGSAGSGKTSLAEALLFKTGATDRLGRIMDGNTVCDFDAEEIKKQASLTSAVAPFEYDGYKINMIDTPGLIDFSAGSFEGVRVADTVVITLSGKSGVAVGTKKAFIQARKSNKPRVFFVGKLDGENADFYKVFEQLKNEFGSSVCPIIVPHYNNDKVECYIDLLEMKAYRFDDKGAASEVPLPESDRLDQLFAAMSEAVAETDEELLDKFLMEEKFTRDELIKGINLGMKNRSIIPVFCGSAYTLEGVELLLGGISAIFPSAEEEAGESGEGEDGKTIEVKCDEKGSVVAYVFKTVADPFVGKLSFFKVISGVLKPDAVLKNMTTGENEKIGKLIFIKGKKQEDAACIVAGDIGAATKLQINTGDTLCDNALRVKLSPIEYPLPCFSMAVVAKSQGDESKISGGISRLLEEDRTLSFFNNAETHQQILSGLGDQHLDVSLAKLKSKFGVGVVLEEPIIAYRETIRKKVKTEGKHKKQTGGSGQFGHVWIEFEPCESEELVFDEKIVGGVVPKGYFPAVEKGLRESAVKGVVAGYPVIGLKATLVDGSYHDVDSNEISFKLAAGIAYRAGLAQASPILLEPISKLKVLVPDNNTGDMMGELNKRRGRVLGMNPSEDSMVEIEAEIPDAETADFTMLVRQLTQGAGSFVLEFERYEPLPGNLEQGVKDKAAELGLI